MAFDTAESLVDQYKSGAERFRQIFGLDTEKIKILWRRKLKPHDL